MMSIKPEFIESNELLEESTELTGGNLDLSCQRLQKLIKKQKNPEISDPGSLIINSHTYNLISSFFKDAPELLPISFSNKTGALINVFNKS